MNEIQTISNSLTELSTVIQSSLPVLVAAPFVVYGMLLLTLRRRR